MSEREIKACVSGSFIKFKPEVDLAIDELTDLGVTVLSPEKGWIYKPPQKILNSADFQFRQLPSETGMPLKNVEDEFLLSVGKSDFLYVVNPGGYVGNSVYLEIGYAIASGVKVFIQEEIKFHGIENGDMWQEIKPKLTVCTIEQAVTEIKSKELSD